MKNIISGSAIALLLMVATPAAAEVGGTITRQGPTQTIAINNIVAIVLEFFTWESSIGTLTFEDGRYNATAGCNGISGSYTVDGTATDFGDSVSTMMYCDGKMENEAALITTFSNATHLTFKDGALVLSYGTTSQSFAATLVAGTETPATPGK